MTARAIEVVDLTMTYGDLRAVDSVVSAFASSTALLPGW